MRIDVTAEHIRDGVPGLGDKCPIALACRAAGLNVSIGSKYAWVYDQRGHPIVIDLPFGARQFVFAFDNRLSPIHDDSVQPFSFDLGYNP
jgi:hypothetical protein